MAQRSHELPNNAGPSVAVDMRKYVPMTYAGAERGWVPFDLGPLTERVSPKQRAHTENPGSVVHSLTFDGVSPQADESPRFDGVDSQAFTQSWGGQIETGFSTLETPAIVRTDADQSARRRRVVEKVVRLDRALRANGELTTRQSGLESETNRDDREQLRRDFARFVGNKKDDIPARRPELDRDRHIAQQYQDYTGEPVSSRKHLTGDLIPALGMRIGGSADAPISWGTLANDIGYSSRVLQERYIYEAEEGPEAPESWGDRNLDPDNDPGLLVEGQSPASYATSVALREEVEQAQSEGLVPVAVPEQAHTNGHIRGAYIPEKDIQAMIRTREIGMEAQDQDPDRRVDREELWDDKDLHPRRIDAISSRGERGRMRKAESSEGVLEEMRQVYPIADEVWDMDIARRAASAWDEADDYYAPRLGDGIIENPYVAGHHYAPNAGIEAERVGILLEKVDKHLDVYDAKGARVSAEAFAESELAEGEEAIIEAFERVLTAVDSRFLDL